MPLKLDNISKRRRDNWILRDFSLQVNSGEVFGLLGASGSGKSTVLRVIGGTDPADSGSLTFDGKPLAAKYKILAGDAASFSWKNLFKSPKDNELSSGEKRLAEFEAVLSQAETVLLLDNPFAVLESSMRDKAHARLRQATAEKNLAVILVTGDFEEAFSACDRLGILHDGSIIQTGTPREIYENPASAAAASALGRNNLIPARRVSFNNQPIPEFQTLTGDHRLQTGKTEKKALGTITQNVTLAIRPEHISISFGASFPEDNLLKAEIVGVQFAGATTRLKLNAGGLMLEALVLRLVGLQEGDECMVGLPPDRIMVLKN